MRRNSVGDVPSQLVIDRVLMTGFVTAVAAGGVALLLAQLFAPLVYVFWAIWPAAFLGLWRHVEVAVARCPDCLKRMKVGAVRCRKCGHSFVE
jgi:hypothetical protein